MISGIFDLFCLLQNEIILPYLTPSHFKFCFSMISSIFISLFLFLLQARVIAVLDWELSTLGNQMSDVAYSCLVTSKQINYFACFNILPQDKLTFPSKQIYSLMLSTIMRVQDLLSMVLVVDLHLKAFHLKNNTLQITVLLQ